MYKEGNAAERSYFGQKVLACKINPGDCPFGNAKNIEYGGEVIGTICSSKGLVELSYKHYKYNMKVKENLKFKIDNKRSLPLKLI